MSAFFVQYESPATLGWKFHADFSDAISASAAADILSTDLAGRYGFGEFSVRTNRVGNFEVRKRNGSGWIGVSDHDNEQDAIDEACRVRTDELTETDVVEDGDGENQIHHFEKPE